MGIKVHAVRLSPPTQRVIAALYEKDLDFEFIPVDMANGDHKKQPFLSLNPFGQVPAFEDGDLKLFESRAITQYIARNYSGKGTELIIADPKKAAVAAVWSEVESQKYEPAAIKLTFELAIKPILGMVTDDAAVKQQEEALGKVLDVYEARLAESKYLGGESFSLVDLHHLPTLMALKDSRVKDLFESRPHVRAWADDILARPASQKVLAFKTAA